jgi:hypothetical protein
MVIESLQKILLAAKQEQWQQQQTITFDYKDIVGDDDDDYNQDEEITSESIDISNISIQKRPTLHFLTFLL